MVDLRKLAEPFGPDDIEWRVQSCGKNNGKIWARVIAYVTNRAIQERLDDVVGPENWKNDYREGPDGGVLCGLSVRVGEEWVTKYDGASNTDIEAVKGGLSGSMKRAAVQWGIGRYLYHVEEAWADCFDNPRTGKFQGKTKDNTKFSWNPPTLPPWALPQGANGNGKKKATAPEPTDPRVVGDPVDGADASQNAVDQLADYLLELERNHEQLNADELKDCKAARRLQRTEGAPADLIAGMLDKVVAIAGRHGIELEPVS